MTETITTGLRNCEVSISDFSGLFDWQVIFGNDYPVEIEVGIGKGRFLIHSANENPDKNYVGIDWAKKYLRIANKRVCRKGVSNVRLFHGDARYIFEKFVPPRSVSVIRVYFPDPWPKKRHHKRRIFQPSTCKAFQAALRPDGLLDVLTDFKDYFDQIVAYVVAHTGLVPMDQDSVNTLLLDQPARTNYEVKYRREGRLIYGAIFRQKVDGKS